MTVNMLREIARPLSRTEVVGIENIPKTGGAILIPNHVSTLDPVLLGIKLVEHRYVRALAKDSLFKTPIVGNVLTKMGHIPVFRNTNSAVESLQVAVSEVMRGEAVVVYPEGTVPSDLSRLGSMKSGAARLALLTGAPLIPIAQWGAQSVVPRGAKFKAITSAFFKRPYHKIVIGEPMESEVLSKSPVSEDNLTEEDILHVTQDIEGTLESMVSPLRGEVLNEM